MSVDRTRLRDGVGAAIGSAVAEGRIVGSVVGVAVGGETIVLTAGGRADREAGTPMSGDAIFLIASCSKPITTAAALRLAERGVVDLDAPITRHLPAFRPAFGGDCPVITLRQLLTHTSGLSYPFREATGGPYHRAHVSSGLDQPGLSGTEQLERLASVPLLFAPGTGWEYSLGVDVAGLLLERAAGRSLPEIVAETVTGPLGMADSGFAVRERARLVAHYGGGADGSIERMTGTFWRPTQLSPAAAAPDRIFDAASYPSGGAGMAGTVPDYLTFVEVLRRGGGSLLSPASVQAMTSDAVPHLPDVMETGWSYGLGTHILRDPARAGGPERAGAFRGSGGYGHTWFADPELGLSVVAFTNTAPEGLRGQFARDIHKAVYAAFG